ncbi:MAG TPA: WXG100 family type VII secretion target [Amycolatopsis sp.]|uniref:WXG100 family type VII secretion target n=1 Tax=Amycolatopsis sp. TaxID=37632 RepID=UPI002B492FFD|nr:WXG100 family type VII secretion target [Amycolatopsis sp.]HKS49394.1 WXG100 family type VII secretion target [Amycolatopsis sp.]
MAGGFTGTPADFADAHQKVNNTKQEMDSQLNKLRSEIEATRDGWQGPAALVFNQVMEAFNEKSVKLNQALEHIAEMLKSSGVQYDTQEQDVNSQLSGLQQALEGL